MKSFFKVLVVVGVMAVSLAAAQTDAEAVPVVASYYGPGFQGQPTASGEPFNMYANTAAHPTLPFGTQIRVCDAGCTVVRVNDRGPYVAGRDLDLSLGAAQSIGLGGVETIDATIVG